MEQIELPKGVLLTQLKRIHHPKGDIYHGMKASEISYRGFGEVYFTSINKYEIKGWKKHSRMISNLIVISGDVRFYIHDEFLSRTYSFDIGETNYSRLTIPSGYWLAFEGLGNESTNLIMNFASIEHEPEEALNLPINSFELS